MPQALSAVYVHLVFPAKDRRPTLAEKTVRERMQAYVGGISKDLQCAPIRVGGVEDHVHLLARLGRTITQADWVKEIKRASSLWVKEQWRDLRDFHWQNGYACFSVSKSNLEQVSEYITNQEEHHQRMTFQDELRTLLHKHGIEFDERYVWD